jgi:hypothetical protein
LHSRTFDLVLGGHGGSFSFGEGQADGRRGMPSCDKRWHVEMVLIMPSDIDLAGGEERLIV